MDTYTSMVLIFIIMILAAVASMQFYRGRKRNIALMEKSIKVITKITDPKEKNFTWLGGYVGYRAYFKVQKDNIEEFDFTVTLVPRQSAFYYPVAKMTTRHDRIYIVIYPYTKIRREAHLIQEGYYHLAPRIENEPILRKDEVYVERKNERIKFKALFERREDLDKLRKLVSSLSNPRDVKHVSLTPSTNVVYVFMKLNVDTLEEDVNRIVKFVNEEIVEN